MKKNVQMEIKREIKTFWDLNHASSVLLEKTKEDKNGSYYTTMASIIFTAFTFEAYLNHLGNLKIKFWNEIDRIKVMSKYQVLCKEFNISIDQSRRPYQTLKKLFEFRNELAHGKSKILSFNKFVSENAKIRDYQPKSKLEEYCTEKNAERAHNDIHIIIKELHEKSGEGEYPFTSGLTIGSTTNI